MLHDEMDEIEVRLLHVVFARIIDDIRYIDEIDEIEVTDEMCL